MYLQKNPVTSIVTIQIGNLKTRKIQNNKHGLDFVLALFF